MLRQAERAGARNSLRQAVHLTMAATGAADRRGALRVMAGLAAADGDAALAALLLGIAGEDATAVDPAAVELATELRGRLGDSAFETAYRCGAELDLDAVDGADGCGDASAAESAESAEAPAVDEPGPDRSSVPGQRDVSGRSAD
jgi:hypothetical protein